MGENWGGEIYIPVPGGETGGIYVEVGELATMTNTVRKTCFFLQVTFSMLIVTATRTFNCHCSSQHTQSSTPTATHTCFSCRPSSVRRLSWNYLRLHWRAVPSLLPSNDSEEMQPVWWGRSSYDQLSTPPSWCRLHCMQTFANSWCARCVHGSDGCSHWKATRAVWM